MASKLQKHRKPRPRSRDEGKMEQRERADALSHSGGVVATARRQGHARQLERPSSSPEEISVEKVGRITDDVGKTAEDERV